MATTMPVSRSAADLGRTALRLDAATVVPFALVLLIGARPLAAFLGLERAVPVALVGAVLAPYAVMLLWDASREVIPRRALLVPVVANAAWVAASAVVLVSGRPDLTIGGRWAVAIVADLVALIAIFQFVVLRRMR